MTYSRRSSPTRLASQTAWDSKRCMPYGVASLACSARCQPFLRSLEREPALKVRQGTTTRFWPGKAGGNPGMQLGERLRPLHNLGRGRLGSGEGDMLELLHDFLLSVETSAVGIHTNRVSHLKVKIVKRFSGGFEVDHCSAYKVQL